MDNYQTKKDYNIVKFTNGYGSDEPYFICEYKGFNISKKSESFVIDKLEIKVDKGDYIIHLGKILEIGKNKTQ